MICDRPRNSSGRVERTVDSNTYWSLSFRRLVYLRRQIGRGGLCYDGVPDLPHDAGSKGALAADRRVCTAASSHDSYICTGIPESCNCRAEVYHEMHHWHVQPSPEQRHKAKDTACEQASVEKYPSDLLLPSFEIRTGPALVGSDRRLHVDSLLVPFKQQKIPDSDFARDFAAYE